MLPTPRLSALVLLALVAVTSCGGAGGGGGSAAGGTKFGEGAPKVEATPEIAALERAMHALLNKDRSKQKLPPVAFDEELAAVARAHSHDMREHRFFAHESPGQGTLEDCLDRAGYLAKVARENLGEGPDVELTQDGLMKSPGHHANIMARDVTHVGIGIVKGGVGAKENLLVTQVFASPIAPVDPEQSGPIVARRIQEARRTAGLPVLPRDPKLDELARKHVGEVTDDLDSAAAKKIGDAVVRALTGSKLQGVLVGTSVFVTPDIYEPGGAAMGESARAVGIATAAAHDARGRPAVKLLLLVGIEPPIRGQMR